MPFAHIGHISLHFETVSYLKEWSRIWGASYKAKILYNHIWFSDLSEDFIDQIYKDKRYRQIINHKNFNPRIIEFITDIDRVDLNGCEYYWDYVKDKLDYPKDIWNDCFKFQNDAYVRNLVALIVFNGGAIQEDELATSFYILNKLECLSNSSHAEKDFDSISRLASKSFVNRNIINKKVVVSLFNPSISDYVINEYRDKFSTIDNIFYSLNTLESLRQLMPLKKSNIISGGYIDNLKRRIFDNAVQQEKSYDYIILVVYLLIDDESQDEALLGFIDKVINDEVPIKNIEYLLSIINANIAFLNLRKYNFILSSISEYGLNEEGLKVCAEFIFCHDHRDVDLLLEFGKQVELFLVDALETSKNDIDLSSMVHFGGDEFSYDYDIDDEDIKKELVDMVVIVANEISPVLFDEIDIDIDDIVCQIDIDGIKECYYDSLRDENNDEHHPSSFPSSADAYQNIDDLFERT